MDEQLKDNILKHYMFSCLLYYRKKWKKLESRKEKNMYKMHKVCMFNMLELEILM